MGRQHIGTLWYFRSRAPRLAVSGFVLLALWPLLAFAEQAALPYAQGVLFRVERQGIPPSHLFGTIHAEDQRVLDLPAEVEAAFTGSQQFVMEVVMDAATLAESAKLLVFADGRTLEGEVGTERYQRARASLGERGYPESMLRFLKPWAAATLLSTPPAKSGRFLDLALYQRAVERGLPVKGLESIAEQLGIFDGLTRDEQLVVLDEALDNQAEMPVIYRRLLDAYLQRDLAGLVAISEEYLDQEDQSLAAKISRIVIDDRNRHMAERLAPLIDAGGAFVAVGALHLPGNAGVLRLLEERGYRITRVY